MDREYIDNLITRRERGYIWLESELKRNLWVSTAVIAVFFLIMRYFNPQFMYWTAFGAAAVVLNVIWNYLIYRREYRSYQLIYHYIEAFEAGNYEYYGKEEFLDTGIHAQLIEQIKRMGSTFGMLKEQLTEEKENTKSLVTDISHQLKTPLAVLEMSYELLEDETLTEEEKFLWAKAGGIMSIERYHYPVIPAVTLTAVVLAVQILITYLVNMNFKKQSLIEKIRFAE